MFNLRILTFSLLAASVTSFDIECTFRTDLTWGYGCDVKSINLTSSKDCTAEKVYGELGDEKSFDDVKFLRITSKSINYFPRGIRKKFKNLEILHLNTQNLTQITHEDLKPFGEKLKYFSIVKSSIFSIDGNLFESTPNLTFVQIESQKMENIHKNTFKPIKSNLETLSVNFPCVDSQTANDREEIFELIDEIKSSCSDTSYISKNIPRECETDDGDVILDIIRIYKGSIIIFSIVVILAIIACIVAYLKPEFQFYTNAASEWQTPDFQSTLPSHNTGESLLDNLYSPSHNNCNIKKLKNFDDKEICGREDDDDSPELIIDD